MESFLGHFQHFWVLLAGALRDLEANPCDLPIASDLHSIILQAILNGSDFAGY